MTRQTEMPALRGCKGSSFHPKRWLHLHKWRHSHYWNGNDRRVLPFCDYPHGIARSGWRCYDCGKFAWDLSDFEFAAVYAVAAGYVKLPPPIKCEDTS